MRWHKREDGIPGEDENRQVLTFSPAYPQGDPMRYRFMGGQFVGMCKEVTHWSYVDDLEPEEEP